MIISVINNQNVGKIRVLESPFSMMDSSLESKLGIRDFGADIYNSGNTSIEVQAYGFIDKEGLPSSECIFVLDVNITVQPGEIFKVKIQCTVNPDDFDFLIISLPSDASGPQLSGEVGVPLPTLSDLNSWVNNYFSGTGNSGVTNTGGNTDPTTTSTSDPPSTGTSNIPSGYLPTLTSPEFSEVTSGNDVTPTITFIIQASDCRMSTNDVSYFNMPTLNNCILENGDGLGHCTLSNQFALSDGPHNLYIACVNNLTNSYNNAINNLDVPLNIDTQPPVISDVYPYEGTYSSSNEIMLHIQSQVSGADSCSAGVYSTLPSNININNPLPIELIIPNLLFGVTLEMGSNYVAILCRDALNNADIYYSGNFNVISTPAVGPAIDDFSIPSHTSKPSGLVKKPRGGGGSSSQDTVPADTSKPPADTPPDTPPVDGGGGVDGAAIQNFSSSQANFIDVIINWFKSVFN